MTTVLITGNTYPVRDSIKALGGRWDAANKGWRVPLDKAEQANALVRGAAVSPRATTYTTYTTPAKARHNWRPCGYPGCSQSYCDECDGRGAGARW